MATLQLDPASGRYRVRFRYEGRAFKRSTHTKHRRVAQAVLGQVEETLRLLKLGMTEIPPGVEPGEYILSGARSKRRQRPRSPIQTVADLFRVYRDELPPGAKEAKTLEGEAIHSRHLLRHLGARTRIGAITRATIQNYVERRSADLFRGRTVGPSTIKKEISTLRMVWNWANRQGYLDTPSPTERLTYSKRDEKPPFQTLTEIERTLQRGGLSEEQQDELWESLYLTRPELEALLETVCQKATKPFVYPLFVLAAQTGMRRSELMRIEIDDLDFEGRTVLIREKKRSRSFATSFRRVPMTSLVERVLKRHLSEHPSKRYVLTPSRTAQLKERYATSCFRATLAGTRWERVRGFHVLRHSFASNAAVEGVDQRMIDEWMGHQTEEMRRRYRHLAPGHQQAAIDTVFGEEPNAYDANGSGRA